MGTERTGFCAPDWWTTERKAAIWTPERRQRQRERARGLHAEGRFGGSEYGRKGAAARRHKVDEATLLLREAVAARAREQAEEIVAKLDAMLNSKNPRLQLAAIKQFFAAEAWVAKHADDAGTAFESMTDEELNAELRAVMSELLDVDFSDTAVEQNA